MFPTQTTLGAAAPQLLNDFESLFFDPKCQKQILSARPANEEGWYRVQLWDSNRNRIVSAVVSEEKTAWIFQ